MQVDLSHLESRVDVSTPETARATLREAAAGARLVADQLRDEATVWRKKANAAVESVHTLHLAEGLYRRAAAADVDADAVRATAAAWEEQADLILDPTPAPPNLPPPPPWVDRLAAGLPHARRATIDRGNQGGVKEKITLPDGTRVFSKQFAPSDRQARQKVDAEELTALVGDALGVPVPRVHRPENALGLGYFADWVDGAALPNARRRPNGQDRAEAMLNSPAAQRIALLDMLTGNIDRHENNLRATPDDQLVGIDHGLAWTGARWIVKEPWTTESRTIGFMQGPAVQHFTRPDPHHRLGPNPSLIMLDVLEPHAAGTRSLIEPRG